MRCPNCSQPIHGIMFDGLCYNCYQEEVNMNNEEREVLNKLAEKLEKTIDTYFDKQGLDRSFFRFTVQCHTAWSNFRYKETVNIIDEGRTEMSGCDFCGEPTCYDKDGLYLCADCYGKIKRSK